MKYAMFLAAGALLTGCEGMGGGKCDSGDTACISGGGGGGSGSVLIQEVNYACDSDYCTWYIYADGQVGGATLDMTETGDDSIECGPSAPGAKDLVCGVWHEYHDNFSLLEENNEYGGDTYAIDLLIVDDYTVQDNNSSTLFDAGINGSSLTVEAAIWDTSDTYADCISAGHSNNWYECEYIGSLN